eukprot:CAMPEP_0172191360 /NCGR_PEP_ID=MMETSP1050-20130122/23654_1 /TAXON_ID=233186 /ORGANISM="Cryptomonas curvata, Strain CCAP979/52" /LENGTH=79 /DNA_ID=CAMNT_0012866393 /DNA_START=89 /DNA_END=324 /DNA_ORIENTATION=+
MKWLTAAVQKKDTPKKTAWRILLPKGGRPKIPRRMAGRKAKSVPVRKKVLNRSVPTRGVREKHASTSVAASTVTGSSPR